MYKATIADIKILRDLSSAGLKDCKNALNECEGNIDNAMDWLRTKGIAKAAKKSSRVTTEGMVHSYIHTGSRLGVLVEINCETDFVARTFDFREFVEDVAMHIAASRPQYVNDTEIPENVVQRETEIQVARVVEEGKPQHIAETKIVPGRILKWKKEISLMHQQWMHTDDKMSVSDVVASMIHKTGENITIRRFVTFELGEGLEKRSDNFADEVAQMTGSN